MGCPVYVRSLTLVCFSERHSGKFLMCEIFWEPYDFPPIPTIKCYIICMYVIVIMHLHISLYACVGQLIILLFLCVPHVNWLS